MPGPRAGTLCEDRTVEAPAIHYAPSASGNVAWQSIGDGHQTLVLIPPLAQNIEMMWEQPTFWRPIHRLASSARFVQYDKLGTGLSDPRRGPASLDDRLDELVAVLDAANIDHAWLIGLSEGGIIALAAAHHLGGRIDGLLLLSTTSGVGARRWAADYGQLPEQSRVIEFFRTLETRWGSPDTLTLTEFAPTLLAVPGMQRWVPAYERAAASPSMIGTLIRSSLGLDVDSWLDSIGHPTLVLHQNGDRVLPVAIGRMLGARLPNATYREIDGRDHFSWVSPTVDEQIDLMLEFVGLAPAGPRVAAAWNPWESLTAAERRVAGLVQRGLSNGEVAAALSISVRTVENHLARCYAKLGLRSRTELAALQPL
jgi:pimeloyl-ACP methyl ester carboxylesterase/DNA-binding CsgD family transcriptional regulator